MQKRKLIAFAMVLVMLISTGVLPNGLWAWADQSEAIFEDLPIMVDPEEAEDFDEELDEEYSDDEEFDENLEEDLDENLDEAYAEDVAEGEAAGVAVGFAALDMPSTVAYSGPAAGEIDTDTGRKVLDIGQADIVIGATGATGGGLTAAETEIFAAGYLIVSSATGAATNTLTLSDGTASAPNTVKLQLADGLSVETTTAPISLGSYNNVELNLCNNTLKATGTTNAGYAYAGIGSKRACNITLNIEGENHVTSAKSAAILVSCETALTIDGDYDAKLYAETSGSKAAAIGTSNFTASGKLYERYPFKSLTINGGQIYATGSADTPDIGSYNKAGLSGADCSGAIIINGGYIQTSNGNTNAGGAICIHYKGTNVTDNPTINGGSVNANVLTHSTTLKKVVVTTDKTGEEFTFNEGEANEWSAAAVGGKFYLYLPMAEEQIIAKCGSDNYIGTIVEDSGTYSATLAVNNNSCTCDSTASLALDGGNVEVLELLGSKQVTLNAKFTKSAACEYEAHNPKVTYSLAAGTLSTDAEINNNVLTVKAAANGKTITVNAEVTVNGNKISTTADFAVTTKADYILDIADGDITIGQSTIKVGDATYTRAGADKVITIKQSSPLALNNHIIIEGYTTAKVAIDGLNLAVSSGVSKITTALFHISNGAEVTLYLNGENKLDAHKVQVGNVPAVYVGGSLTIEGDGALTALGGTGLPGIGGNTNGSQGSITINGGLIEATGGNAGDALGGGTLAGAGGIGASSSGTEGTVTINGGMVIVSGGDGTSEEARDFSANVVINGGSVVTRGADGSISPEVKFFTTAGSLPKDQYSNSLYRTELTLDGAPANKLVTFYYDSPKAAEISYKTYTDAAGKIYLYLPSYTHSASGSGYHQVRAEIDGGDTYYQRMVIDSDDDNTARLITQPGAGKAAIAAFEIDGQISSSIDEENKTIAVDMPVGTDITSLEPTVTAVDDVTAATAAQNAVEYTPMGARDFTNPVEYSVIAADGTVVKYTVTVTESDFAGEPTVLDVSKGKIYMMQDSSGKVTVKLNGKAMPDNPNGYVICGKNSDECIEIHGVSRKIVLRDLELSNSSDKYAIKLTDDNNLGYDITVDGVCSITTNSDYPALLLDNSLDTDSVAATYKFGGAGVLKLYSASTGSSGDGVAVKGSGDVKFIIKDGLTMFASQAGSGTSLQTQNEEGKKTYPLTVTIESDKIKGKTQKVKYQDGSMAAAVEFLAYAESSTQYPKITVYRPIGSYEPKVSFEVGANTYSCRGDSTKITTSAKSVSVGEAKITKLVNQKNTQTSIGSDKWGIKVEGKYIGGEIKVIATGQDSNIAPIEATAALEGGIWIAYLDIPDNLLDTEYVYTVTVSVDGEVKTDVPELKITMLPKLEITQFTVQHQIGTSTITEDSTGRYIECVMPYDLDLDEAAISAVAKPDDSNKYQLTPANNKAQKFMAGTDGKHTLTWSIMNWASGDTASYKVTLTNEATPNVTAVTVGAVDCQGGAVELEVTGTDLASLANAINYQNGKDSSKPKADCIIFTVNNKDYSLTADKISGNSGKITVNVPANTVAGGAGLTAATYPVTVKINGVEQTLTTAAKVVVPAELAQDTTIVACSFGDQLSYTAADKAEVGYDEMAVDHAAGTIAIKVPWGTDMSKLVPKVVLKNSKATFSPKNIALTADPTNEKVGTQNITVTAVDGTTKIYKLTATWAATALEKNAEIKSVSFGDQLDYDQDNNVMNFDKAVIDHTAGTVKVVVPWPTKLADLTPAVELNHSGADYSPKNTKLPVPTGAEPVSVDQNITVTAVDGTTKTYVLTVERVADEAEKDAKIKSFELEFMLNLEIGTTPDANGCLPIDVMVDRSADMTKLNPTIKLGHKNASYVPVGEQNFAEAADNTIIYTVTAVDGTKQKYAVKITQKKNSGGGSTYSVSTAKQEVTAFVTGKEDGNFHPDDMMSRSEAATMLARVHSKFDKNAKYKTDYADVDSSSWYANYVGFLQKQGVVQGNEMGEFMPEKQITRMEFATMMARLAGLPIDKDAVAAFKDIKGTWGEKEITALVEQEIVNGYEDNTFRPNNNISRAEAVAMVNRLMKRGISDEELAALKTVENPFGDIDESHWAYNDIICAVTDYTVTTKTETLGKISDESVTVKINK